MSNNKKKFRKSHKKLTVRFYGSQSKGDNTNVTGYLVPLAVGDTGSLTLSYMKESGAGKINL